MKTKTVHEKEKAAFEVMKGDFAYSNPMQVPQLKKVVVSVGVGSVSDKKRQDMISQKLAILTGQKAASRNARRTSVAFPRIRSTRWGTLRSASRRAPFSRSSPTVTSATSSVSP
jgi:ribosomal protein L5